MKCTFCKQGTTKQGNVTVTLSRENTVVVIKNVPAEVCENCSEYFLSEKITEQILSWAEDAVEKGAEVEILRYAA
jgi:YgiT-type zinc finger domain-containing protein